MAGTVLAGGSVEVEEMSADEARRMVQAASQETFGLSWDDFFAAYKAGAYVGTENARAAEELAFLVPFAG